MAAGFLTSLGNVNIPLLVIVQQRSDKKLRLRQEKWSVSCFEHGTDFMLDTCGEERCFKTMTWKNEATEHTVKHANKNGKTATDVVRYNAERP